MADFTDLDWAFTCPASVTDDDLRAGYEILTARFRAEGEHLPLNTAWQLLIERTVNAYIKVKQAERKKYKEAGGFEHPGQEKDYNIYVQNMLHEINEVLRKHYPTADRDLTLQQVREVILDVMGGIPDAAVRDDLARRFAAAFEQSGL
jgi:uncharacterized protein YejL (UPF0352 family)